MEEMTDLTGGKHVATGGIGVIIEKNEKIYKVFFFPAVLKNNMDGFNLLKNKLMIGNRTGNELNGVMCPQKCSHKRVNLNALSSICGEELCELYKKNKSIIDRGIEDGYVEVFALQYEKADLNLYCLFQQLTGTDREVVFSFFIIWIFVIIYHLNHELHIFHNDLKLDNILVRRKSNVTVYKIGNFVIYNRTPYDFFLNDLDMMLDKCVYDDIARLKESLKKTFASEKSKLIRDILNKLENIKTPRDIFIKWLNRSSLFRYMMTSDIIESFLSTDL
jgi:hypothetical protein